MKFGGNAGLSVPTVSWPGTYAGGLHDGCASDWSRQAEPGDTIDATVQGTGFEVPDPLPPRMLVIGDPASLPAINSLLSVAPKIRKAPAPDVRVRGVGEHGFEYTARYWISNHADEIDCRDAGWPSFECSDGTWRPREGGLGP